MAGSHSIKNKTLDVKKALSKAELSKLQAGKNNNNDSNQHSVNTPDWNQRGPNGPMVNDGWSGPRPPNGPPMNMPSGGYGPGPTWGKHSLQMSCFVNLHYFVTQFFFF